MPTLAAFLLSIAGSIAARVLVSLGIGIVAAKGADLAFNSIENYFKNAQSAFAPEVMQLMGVWGVNTAMNMMLGAISFTFSMKAAQKAIRFFSTK